MCFIYALVDPLTHLVRYVGQTMRMDPRYRVHCSGKDPSTGMWVRSLPQAPILVLLETVEQKIVPCKGLASTRSNSQLIKASTIAETKWIKRFRRTLINTRTRENSRSTWDWLTNPDEVGGGKP
jgi:hypothetical protein